MDGEVVGGGSGLYTGNTIKYGGILVVGQDQDSFGGGFDPKQTWNGQVSGLNVWRGVRSTTDIITEFQDCHVTKGDTIQWPQLYDDESLHGDVVIYP